jgi:3-oxosteroid 1-dehydrogenase
VTRFNEMARHGVDEDFDRGRTAYDHVYSDPSHEPNPNLGTIERSPFYAVKVWPGDLGTKGGLLTDEHARVLREDGQSIRGLYAAGNTTASVMGRTYPGPGSTIGPATTFAYIAMRHLAKASAAADAKNTPVTNQTTAVG